MRLRQELVVFVLALVVRTVYLYQSADSPAFEVPFLDEQRYHELAIALNSGAPLTEAHFWQSILYPKLLALLYWFAGPSLWFAKLSQCFLDAMSCALVALLGRQLLEARVGFIAGCICILYGPLVFFSSQLLSATLECFWAAVLLLLLQQTDRRASYPVLGALGLVGAFAALTRPLFLPFLLVAYPWLLYRHGKSLGSLPLALKPAAVLLGSFALVVVPAAWERHGVTGDYSILPISGALNLHIGNNPDRCATVQIRGYAWEQLVASPFKGTSTPPAEQTDTGAAGYFAQALHNYIRSDPLDFAKGLLFKGAQLFQSQEIPRNTDMYLNRQWSSLLSGLVWKLGPFGFPFGILVPLSIFGAVQFRTRLPWFVPLFLVTYSAAIVAVFVSARYRLPLVPLLAVLAAAGVYQIIYLIQGKLGTEPWKRGAVFGLAGGFFSVLPTARCEFSPNYEAEFSQIMGAHHLKRGELSLAAHYLSQAVALEPTSGDAHYNLGLVEAQQEHPEAALEHWKKTLESYPNHAPAQRNSGLVALRLGLDQTAYQSLVAAHHNGAVSADELAQIGLQLVQEQRKPLAVRFLQQAIELGTSRAEAASALSQLRAQSER